MGIRVPQQISVTGIGDFKGSKEMEPGLTIIRIPARSIGKIFAYDENKKAYIKDPLGGPYKDLVKAAEKCPARCIHPGKPREGDPTVTDALRVRAAKFD